MFLLLITLVLYISIKFIFRTWDSKSCLVHLYYIYKSLPGHVNDVQISLKTRVRTSRFYRYVCSVILRTVWYERSHGVMVSTQDSESCDPSSNLGET